MAFWKLISGEAEWGPVIGSYFCQQLEQLFTFVLQRCSNTWELFKRFGKMLLIAVANINTSFCRHSVFVFLAGLAHLDPSTLLKAIHTGCQDMFGQQNRQSHEFSHTFFSFLRDNNSTDVLLSAVSALLIPHTYGCTNNEFLFCLAIELRNWKNFLVLVDQKVIFRQAKMKQFA